MTELMKEKIMDGIDDKYLGEAIAYTKSHKRKTKKWIVTMGKIAACLAIVIGMSMSSLSIAVAAGNIDAYHILHEIYPEIANNLMPVNVSCEDNGIRMEVEGVSIQDNCAYVYISMQDLEGIGLDESIDLFDSYRIHTNADQIGGCTLIDFDETNKKATFLITIQNMDGTAIEGSAMTFSVSKFLTGKSEVKRELTEICLNSISEVSETQKEKNVNIGGGSYSKESEYLYVDECKVFVPTPGVTVTNYGFVNDKLHVQVYYEDILQFDNHGYVYLSDIGGKDILPTNSIAFWDEEKKGSYEEYVFDISADEMSEYAICGHFFTCQNLVEGDWEVRFTID